MTCPIVLGRNRNLYRKSLLLGTAILIEVINVDPAAAQCLSSSSTTTICTASGNPYPTGIAVDSLGDHQLILEDGVSVISEPGLTGLSLASTGNAVLSGQGTTSVVATGDDGAGVTVRSGGDVNVILGDVSTQGANASALDVKAGGRATVQLTSATTTGERSAAIRISTSTGISLTADTVTTSGDGASGVIAASNGAITLNARSVVVNGYTSDQVGAVSVVANGVETTSRGGDVSLTLGSIVQNGDGGGAIATSYGGGVNIAVNGTPQGGSAVTGGVQTADAIALEASALSATVDGATPGQSVTYPTTGDPARAGIVSAIVGKGASVSTAYNAAVSFSATKGTNLTNNGTISRDDWWGNRAIQISGGAATVVNNGTLIGVVRLTENADTFTNNGTFTTSGISDFDDNETAIGTTPNRLTDTLINTGTIRVQPNVSFQQYPVFRGVEVFRNSGLIDLRSGTAGDVISFVRSSVDVPTGTPVVLGQYIASGNATIGLDLQFQDNGALVDVVRFTADGGSPLAVSGTTKVIFNILGNATPKLLVGLPVIVVASGGSGTFEMAKPMVMGGLQYALLYDPRQTAWALYAAPDAAVLRQTKVPTNVQALWHRAADVVLSHLREERDRRWTDAEPGSRLWIQAIGSSTTRTESYSATINRIPISGLDFSQRQTIYGMQAGIDTAGPEAGETGMIFGATVGYLQSTAQFRTTRDKLKIDAIGLGAYASLLAGPAFLTATANYARHSVDDRLDEVGNNGKIRGDSYGVRIEGGVRLGNEALFVEPSASIAYAVTAIDRVALTYGRITFDELISSNGAAGLRVGGRTTVGERELVYYAGGEAVHEFAGDDQARLTSGGLEVAMPTNRLGTYGRGTIGLSLVSDTRFSAFIEGQGVVGKGYSGGSGRIGLRLPL